MPIRRRFDFQIGGAGFLLVREAGKRAWNRTGLPDTPSRRSDTDTKYGVLPDEIDHPEVWDDLSGGYGLAYRRQGENRYHWAENFECVPGDTLISSPGRVKGATKRWFDGDLVEVITSRGYKLAATPNHPILTPTGWVGIGVLAEGDQIVYDTRVQPVAGSCPDEEHMVATIKHIFGLTQILGATERIRGATEQFHGDGQDSEVNIVLINRELGDSIDPCTFDPTTKYPFHAAFSRQMPLERHGLIDPPTHRVPFTSQPSPHRFRHRSLLVGSHSGIFQPLDLRPGAELNAGLCKNFPDDALVNSIESNQIAHTFSCQITANQILPIDGVDCAQAPSRQCIPLALSHATETGIHSFALPSQRDVGSHQSIADPWGSDMKLMHDREDALPCEIALDHIVSVKRVPFHGFVYNLHTQVGWYTANGIITHNCRFPRQLVHCQIPYLLSDRLLSNSMVASMGIIENVDEIVSTGLLSTNPGMGEVGLFGRGIFAKGRPTASGIFFGGNTIYSGTGAHPVAIFGNWLNIGQLESTRFLVWDPISSATSTASFSGVRFAVAGNKLWRASGSMNHAGYLNVCATPDNTDSAGNWGATYNIGNLHQNIKDMIALDDQVFLGTDSGLYAGDQTGTFVNVLSELAGMPHNDNCRDLAIWENSVIAQHVAGVFRYLPSRDVEEISPPRSDRSPITGMVRSLRGYGRYLYGGLYTGSQSWLLAGERQQRGVAWHTLQRLPHNTKVSRIFIDGITTGSDGVAVPNRIWIATDGSIDTSGTAPVYYWPIPTLDGNPLAPGGAFSANYIGSARIDLGSVDGGAPSTPKVYRSVEVWADTLLSGYRYCDVYYDIDQSGSFALLGRAQTSPKTTLYHSSGEGSYVTGQSIEYSLRSFTASPALTPVYRAIVARWALRPNSVDEITAVVRVADNMRDRQGGEMRSAATMIAELRALAKQATPTTLIDLSGAVNYVNVLPPVNETEIYQKGEQEPEIAATIKMAVLTFS